jgi:hypothetical protein
LAQIPPNAAVAQGELHSGYPAARQTIARGEFVGLACWITSAQTAESPQRDFEPTRPDTHGGIAAQGEDPAETGFDLAALLDAITEDVQGRAAAARAGIRAEFAARIRHVRKHVSGFARAAAVSALGEARKAALALINQNAALELAGLRQAAIKASAGKARNAKGVRALKTYKPLADNSPR